MQVHMSESVHMCSLVHAHTFPSKVQFLQVSLFHYYEIGLLSQSDIKVSRKKITDPEITLLYSVSSESRIIKIIP